MEQISNLHLGVARMLDAELDQTRYDLTVRGWISFHITDDAVRESTDEREAYALMMEELRRLGVRQAHLYLLPDTVTFMGSRTFVLSDAVRPIAHLRDGAIEVRDDEPPLALQGLLDHALDDEGGRGRGRWAASWRATTSWAWRCSTRARLTPTGSSSRCSTWASRSSTCR